MSNARPLLLLDIDGVLNPYAAEVCPAGYREYDLFPGEGIVRVAEAHGSWLRAAAEVFELTWATGWRDEANRRLGPVLGLPELPVIEFPHGSLGELDWKVPAIRTFVGDRPLAWLDDSFTPGARRWAAERQAPTLLVDIDPGVGLTEGTVTDLHAWAAGLS